MINREESERKIEFKRNGRLEELLFELNELLSSAENSLLDKVAGTEQLYPVVFVMGPLRSGTTLFMQWLASTGIVAYPTNMLSRFYGVPAVGAKIQRLLTDPLFNFRDEILDFNSKLSFNSVNGKTTGALSPNEFWYFWRRFIKFGDIDWLPDDELLKSVDVAKFSGELALLTNVFEKPFALKGMILNYNIGFLSKVIKNSIFIQIKRDAVSNVASVLDARRRQLGSEAEWYSFKIREYPELKKLSPVDQVAGQVFYNNKAIENGIQGLPSERKLVVNYEEFCNNPVAVFNELVEKIGITDVKYTGPDRFTVTRHDISNKEEIISALSKFS